MTKISITTKYTEDNQGILTESNLKSNPEVLGSALFAVYTMASNYPEYFTGYSKTLSLDSGKTFSEGDSIFDILKSIPIQYIINTLATIETPELDIPQNFPLFAECVFTLEGFDTLENGTLVAKDTLNVGLDFGENYPASSTLSLYTLIGMIQNEYTHFFFEELEKDITKELDSGSEETSVSVQKIVDKNNELMDMFSKSVEQDKGNTSTAVYNIILQVLRDCDPLIFLNKQDYELLNSTVK